MYRENKSNPFNEDGDSLDEALHGKLDLPVSGAVRIKPVGLDEIRPDLKQPRRAIPQKVRGDWNGNPGKISDLLMKWRVQCEFATGAKVGNMKDLLTGLTEFPEEFEGYTGIVESYVSLVTLAQDIYKVGLTSPITIYEDGGQKYVLTGERRYLAHWLLRLEVDRDAFSKIPAQLVTYSVRQQVSENTARRDLNAVGLARCYALMVMELYKEEGKTFMEFNRVVRPGECDRMFYAQVKDMPVPYGKAPEVMSAMSVKSRQSINNYKSVLSVTDDVWKLADNEDWSLRQIMDWIEAQKPEKPQVSRENVQRVGHFSDDNPSPRQSSIVSPSPQSREGEQERESIPVGVRRVPPVRVDQWEDDEDYRPHPPTPSPQSKEGERVHEPVQRETPPEMDGVTWLVDDPELIDWLEMWLKIFDRRGDTRGKEITKSLLSFSGNDLAQYPDVTEVQVAMTEVIDMYEENWTELIERFIGLHEKFSSEYEDLHGLGRK